MDVAGATLDLDGFNTTVAYLNEASSTANRNIALGGATLTINPATAASIPASSAAPAAWSRAAAAPRR